MNFQNVLPEVRVSSKRVIIARILILLLLLANLSFIWYNSSKTAKDSTDISKSVTKSVAPHVIDKFDELSKDEQDKEIAKLNPIIRGMAHSLEYIPLGILLFLLMLSVFKIDYGIKNKNLIPVSVLSFVIALLFALTDEIHQMFVDGRTFELKDIALDMLGMFIGYVFLSAIFAVYKIKNKNNFPLK